MNIDQLANLLMGKDPVEVMEICRIPDNPLLQVARGYDMTNITVTTIPGAVRFEVWEKSGDQYTEEKFPVGYVLYVNGPMSPLYDIKESDYDGMAGKYPPAAIAGLKNSRLICAPRGRRAAR